MGDAPGASEQPRAQAVLYNQRIMEFLDAQLEKLRGLEKPAKATAKELANFKLQFGRGERLLAKHADHFDIKDFYGTQDACEVVEEICGCLREIIEDWGMGSMVHIKDTVPSSHVEEDEELLERLLNFTLRDAQSDAEPELLQQWEAIRARHKDDVKQLEITDEDAIRLGAKLGKGGQGVVLKATWHDAPVAVKKPARGRGDLPIAEFANFFKEVIMHAILSHHPYIVQLLAATVSGWIVMELADTDLHMLCHGKQRLALRLKARLLQQGAAGLAYIHSKGQVHGDIKPRNLLVFGTHVDNWCLKVSDFGLSFEASPSRSKTGRPGCGTPQYIAPELYDNKPLDQKSDIYSFGVVCYEAISQKPPFGGEATGQYAIIAKKLKGEEPCAVEPEDCPPHVLEFLRQCCALDPSMRPTMKDISNFWLQVSEEQSSEDAKPPSPPLDRAMEKSSALAAAPSRRSRQGSSFADEYKVAAFPVEQSTAEPADIGAVPVPNFIPSGRELLAAAKEGNLAAMEMMLHHGIDVDAQDAEGRTALIWAAFCGHVGAVEKLVSLGADVHHADKEGKTALFWAARKGNVGAVEKLVSLGADVHHVDEEGNTALLHAAFWRRGAVLERLLAAGADVNHVNKVGKTALRKDAECYCWWAWGHESVADVLLRHGANH